MVSYWTQQLIAESLGKKVGFPNNIENSKICHSLMQLYLDGPKDKLFVILAMTATKIKKN